MPIEPIGSKIRTPDKSIGETSKNILAEIKNQIPELTVEALGISEESIALLTSPSSETEIIEKINQTDLIVGDWTITQSSNQKFNRVGETIQQSTAHKLLFPTTSQNLNWIGVLPQHTQNRVSDTVSAIRQYLEGEEIKQTKGPGLLNIFAGLIAFFILMSILGSIFSF